MSLQQIFNSITPDNIKNIDLINDAMEIFINNLEENSEISIDIKKIYESENINIRENILKIYISSLYSIISKAQENELIAKKLESRSTSSTPLKRNIIDVLNGEYLITNKSLKERTGTTQIIEHTYNLAKYLQDDVVNADDFILKEIKPFYFQAEGSIYREVYEYIVKPLSHPIGFTYNYVQAVNQSIKDYFGVDLDFIFNKIEIRCLSGHYDVFTQANDDISIKADFLTRINFLTNELFTEADYNTYITVWTNKNAIDIQFINIDNSTDRTVIFDDGTIIKQNGNPISVYYRNLIDETENNTNYLKTYNSQCSLYVDYDQQFNFTYTDTISFEMDETIPKETYNTVNDTQESFESVFSSVAGGYITTTDNNYIYTTDEYYIRTLPT